MSHGHDHGHDRARPAADGVEARYRRVFARGEGAERIAAYSDAVFAFAMTLLAVDLAIPDAATSAAEVLETQIPHFFAFALSFTIVAYVWMGHHRRFRVIVRHDTGLMVWNLVLLFLIAAVPFPTALISRFAPEEPAVITYAAMVTAIIVVQMFGWWHMRRAGLLAKSVDRDLWVYVVLDFVPTVIVFGLSIPIALLLGGQTAMYWWFVLFVVAPVMGILSSRRIDRAERAASSSASSEQAGAPGSGPSVDAEAHPESAE
jgi:uncharacterized membrane protein